VSLNFPGFSPFPSTRTGGLVPISLGGSQHGLQDAVDVSVAEPVTADENCLRLMRVPGKSAVKSLEWILLNLVKFPTAGDQCRGNHPSMLGRRPQITAVLFKMPRKIALPNYAAPRLLAYRALVRGHKAMMDAPVEVIDEIPVRTLMDRGRKKTAVICRGIEAGKQIRRRRKGERVVIQRVDANFKMLLEPVQERRVGNE